MPLLQNAISAIKVGLEDFRANTDERLISAVRNIHAGILLLYKAKLMSVSPAESNEVLLKQRIVPKIDAAKGLVFVGSGKKTVDANEIQERFKSLGIITDWKRFEKINELRNYIEHYYSHVNKDTIREIISNTFIIIRDFIKNELKVDPAVTLGKDSWETLLSVYEVFKEGKKECTAQLNTIDWQSSTLEESVSELSCNDCGASLLSPSKTSCSFEKIELVCRSCNAKEDYESFIERAIKEHLSGENFLAMKDGGEVAYVTCPYCGKDTYIIEEERCALCGETCERTCKLCGNKIIPEELSEDSSCGWCSHMMSKGD